MARLTKRDTYGHFYTNSEIHDRMEFSKDEEIHHICNDGEAITRLASLEDVLYAPDGTPVITLDELKELVQAKQEGSK